MAKDPQMIHETGWPVTFRVTKDVRHPYPERDSDQVMPVVITIEHGNHSTMIYAESQDDALGVLVELMEKVKAL